MTAKNQHQPNNKRCEREGDNISRHGRNCYLPNVDEHRLKKADEKLQCYIDTKRQLESELIKTLDAIRLIDERIHQLECKIEKLISSQASFESKKRMQEEIEMIKEDKKYMDCEIKKYRKRLEEKMKKLEECKNQHGSRDSCEK